jgi:hypothetical protein
MVTMKFGFDEALPILLPCEIHSFFLTHLVVSTRYNIEEGTPHGASVHDSTCNHELSVTYF